MIRILFILLLFNLSASAKIYYISASGNDANSGSITAPWKTIAKLNSFTGLLAGDQVLFNRGETFYGAIVINKSGGSANPIMYGAYGSGADPVITGFTTVSNWTNLGGNIWESVSAVSNLKAVNQVAINGVNTPMGRYPNTGYLVFNSHTTNTSITSNSLNSAITNWTGAEVVIRKAHWILDRCLVTSQSGGTLNYKSPSTDNAQDGYGFFIENDVRTLDIDGEWYYNPATRKIRIYSTATPTNVKVASIDTLVYNSQKSYLTFDGLSFEGCNVVAFELYNCQNITVQNCSINFSGNTAIDCRVAVNVKLQNNDINHAGDFGIKAELHSTGIYIGNNTIRNIGIIQGMGAPASRFTAIMSFGSNALIEFNQIDTIGFMGVNFLGNNTIIKNNLINYYTTVIDDGGGIYMYNLANVIYSGDKVIGNIVLNARGAPEGTANNQYSGEGIYMDNNSNGVEISGNTVANCGFAGLFIHSSNNLQILDNTIFNNNYVQIYLRHDNPSYNLPLRNVSFRRNILIAKASTQPVLLFSTVGNDMALLGSVDSNYYARPIDDNLVFKTDPNGSGVRTDRTLSGWQSFSTLDIHSKKSPKAVTNINDLRLEYNATKVNKTITLDGNYIDIKNAAYNGSITLAPYTSAILIRNGAVTNRPPIANAGSDQTVNL